MAKQKTQWKCSNCNHVSSQWAGKCLKCNEYSTIIEVTLTADGASPEASGLKSGGAIKPSQKARTLTELKAVHVQRTPSGIGELDRVLGGGFVTGEVVLLAASPGAGKSTLSLRLSEIFGKLGQSVLYSSGEESESQIKLRADRMGITEENIHIIHETNLETLVGHIDEVEPKFIVVDSLQTLASSNITSSIGSIQQSKEAAHTLTRLAKTRGITMVLINQVTKGDSGDPTFAGSNQIAHIVDCVLYIESDRDSPLKFMRATKNRFGDATEVGIFQHSETGLEEVSDPSGVLLDIGDPLPGEATGFISEGIRQIPVEVQALVAESSLTNPRKQFSSVDHARGQIICAILDKFTELRLYDSDVFVSTTAGIKVKDPLADLAIAASILSSAKDKKNKVRTIYIGEMTLTGRIKGSMIASKIKEAERLGFDRAVIPASAKSQIPKTVSMEVKTIDSITELPKLV